MAARKASRKFFTTPGRVLGTGAIKKPHMKPPKKEDPNADWVDVLDDDDDECKDTDNEHYSKSTSGGRKICDDSGDAEMKDTSVAVAPKPTNGYHHCALGDKDELDNKYTGAQAVSKYHGQEYDPECSCAVCVSRQNYDKNSLRKEQKQEQEETKELRREMQKQLYAHRRAKRDHRVLRKSTREGKGGHILGG